MASSTSSADEYDADEVYIPQDSKGQDASPSQTQHSPRKGCSLCRSLQRRFPRTFALIFQVFLPLYSLIAIAMVFGYFLCRLEAPGEKHSNNMALAAAHMMDQLAKLNEMTLTVFPLICLDRYINRLNDSGPWQDPLEKFNNQLFVEDGNAVLDHLLLDGELDLPNVTVSNLTSARFFTAQCGKMVNQVVRRFQEAAYNDDTLNDYIGAEVTFNWIKCPVNKTEPDVDALGLADVVTETFATYDAGLQFQFAYQRWENDLNKTFAKYYAQYRQTPNLTSIAARGKAIGDAYAIADGFDHCVEDVMAAAWWAFTVMTTIGFGNVTPTTEGGRTLVYTFGFFTIIVFAGVLGTAGHVITTIIDDLVGRLKCTKWLKIPLIQMLMWGTLFYSFLCVIAQTAIYWKRERVGVEVPFKDAYWFSFVSATTVGFGDIFLEHETITWYDVVMFASLILVAFVLLSSFLNKLAELVQSLRTKKEDGDGPTFEERLKNTNICGCFH